MDKYSVFDPVKWRMGEGAGPSPEVRWAFIDCAMAQSTALKAVYEHFFSIRFSILQVAPAKALDRCHSFRLIMHDLGP